MEEFHEYKDLSDIVGIKGECSQNRNNIYQGKSPDTHNAILSVKWILGLLKEELLFSKKQCKSLSRHIGTKNTCITNVHNKEICHFSKEIVSRM